MVFQLPRVQKCCCCIPLRIGSLIIGYLSIVFSCFVMSLVAVYIYKVVMFVDKNNQNPKPEHPPEEVAKLALSLYVSFGYYILVFLYNLVINLLLVIGVHKNKPRYLQIYVKATLYLFTLGVALVVVTTIFMGFLATVPVLKWCVTLLVCAIIVRSTYLEMEEQNKPRVYEMQSLYMPQQAPLMA